MRKFTVIILSLFVLFTSCKDAKEEKIIHLFNEWNEKMIHFPKTMNLISYVDTSSVVKFGEIKKEYTILHYVDTIGCVSCKLQLSEWSKLIKELDSIGNHNVNCLIIFFPMKKKDLLKSLKINEFKNYVYIDERDSLNRLNNFPEEDAFRTFLLNRSDKVIAIGNPVHNPKVKELYMNIIQGKMNLKEKNIIQTEVQIKEQTISFGHFNWKKEQKANFIIHNVGKHPLVINDIVTSCGCTSVNSPKEPVCPGDSISLQVTYKADKPEHFNKTITVYCNANPSLIHLKIVGDAE